MDATLYDFAQDMNACASEALEALAAGDADKVRLNLRAITDAAREIIDAHEEGVS